jgi:hypothetical protein
MFLLVSCSTKKDSKLFDSCGEKVYLDKNNWYNISCSSISINDTIYIHKAKFKTKLLNGIYYLTHVKNQLWLLSVDKQKPVSNFKTIHNYVIEFNFDMNQQIGCQYKDSVGFMSMFLMAKRYSSLINDTLFYFGTKLLITCPWNNCENNKCWIISKHKGLLGFGCYEFVTKSKVELFDESFLVPNDTVISIIENYNKKEFFR